MLYSPYFLKNPRRSHQNYISTNNFFFFYKLPIVFCCERWLATKLLDNSESFCFTVTAIFFCNSDFISNQSPFYSTPLIRSTTVPCRSNTFHVTTGIAMQTAKLMAAANRSGTTGTKNETPR